MIDTVKLRGAVAATALAVAVTVASCGDNPVSDALRGDLYVVTFDFSGLGDEDLLPAWRSAVIRAANECLDDDTIRRVRIVFENVSDDVDPTFARSTTRDCEDLISMADEYMTD